MFPDGTLYSGQFFNGKRQGHGVFSLATGFFFFSCGNEQFICFFFFLERKLAISNLELDIYIKEMNNNNNNN